MGTVCFLPVGGAKLAPVAGSFTMQSEAGGWPSKQYWLTAKNWQQPPD